MKGKQKIKYWFIALVVIAALYIPVIFRFADIAKWFFPDENNANGEFLKILLSSAAGIGVFFTVYFSFRRSKAMEDGVIQQSEQIKQQSLQIELTRESQLDERFKNAIEHISNTKHSVIVGGLAELNQIANADPTKYAQIISVILCDFIREYFPIENNPEERSIELKSNINKCQVALNFLYDEEVTVFSEYKKDLSACSLKHFDFQGKAVINTKFSNSRMPKLSNCVFSYCVFEKSSFWFDLRDVRFLNCNFIEACFINSLLYDCIFTEVKFKRKTQFFSSTLENITFENYSEIKSCAFYASSLKSCDFNSTGFERNSFYGCVCQNLKFNISNDDIPVFQVIEFYACDFLNIDISNKIELKNITFLSCLSEIMYSPEEFEFQIEVHTDKVNDIREFNSNNPEANDGFHFQIINSSLSQTLNNKYSIELQNCIK